MKLLLKGYEFPSHFAVMLSWGVTAGRASMANGAVAVTNLLPNKGG